MWPIIRNRINLWLLPSGVALDGPNPWDPQVDNPWFLFWAWLCPSYFLGRGYEKGAWRCYDLKEFFHRLVASGLNKSKWPSPWDIWMIFRLKFFNLQNRRRSLVVGRKHYDLTAAINRSVGPTGAYSCAYPDGKDTLDDAQERKWALICQKLRLCPGMSVLDVGCGNGGLPEYMAKYFQVSVVGITISEEQANLARERCCGLPVEIFVMDYRDLDSEKKFDRVVSVGMAEHVGHKNMREYMEKIRSLLKDDGLFLFHSIIGNEDSRLNMDAWLHYRIFPFGQLPNPAVLDKAMKGVFHVLDFHAGLGKHYVTTLMWWWENFFRSWNAELSSFYEYKKYDARFFRIWKYYLHCCAGAFQAGSIDVWQLVLSPKEDGGYEPVR